MNNKPHPLADMICQQARTGQPVWVKTTRPYYLAEYEVVDQTRWIVKTNKPNWHIPGAEYSLTPFEGGSMKLCENCNKKKARIRFCSNKCKDRFHNKQNPRGFFSNLPTLHSKDQSHMIAMDSREDGWDGHKDTF